MRVQDLYFARIYNGTCFVGLIGDVPPVILKLV